MLAYLTGLGYTIFLYLLRPVVLLSFIWRSKADPAYRQRFAERLAWQQVPAAARGGIVLHAVSVGEVVAATPLIEALLATYPELPLTVTCTTATGSARLNARFGLRIYHCYLPFDTPGANRRFLNKLAPQLLILMETELWPNLIKRAASQQIPVLLVNARLSARSARGYLKVAALVRPMLQRLSAILTQDQASASRFDAVSGQKIAQRVGNLKFDLQLSAPLMAQAAEWRQHCGNRPVLVAGSTHAGEDELLLKALPHWLAQYPDLLLILVPRHPDRFEAVAAAIDQTGFSFERRSQQQLLQSSTQVLLADSMGELMLWYQLADLVLVGGSLIPRGGHNPLEAMCLGKPILSGRHIFNFQQIYQWLQRKQAVVWLQPDDLVEPVLHLLQDRQEQQRLAAAGLHIYQQHGGATAALLGQIAKVFRPRQQLIKEHSTVWLNPLAMSPANNTANSMKPQASDYFAPEFWQQQQLVRGQSKGRNTVWFVEAPVQLTGIAGPAQSWVLRHYYRGGLIGKLNKDLFWPVTVAESRAMAEFALLQRMRLAQLPVPEPIAAQYQQQWFGYTANILIRQIADSSDLYVRLQQQSLVPAQWQHLGHLIRRFQQAGVYHSDLNCHNILLDQAGQFWLIDFDKCALQQQHHADWQSEMLARLLRSLHKESAKVTTFYFNPADWQQLLLGYHAENGQMSVQ